MEERLVAQTTHCAMGTLMTHKAFGPHAQEGLDAVRRTVERLEGRLSRFSPDSDVGRVNRSAGVQREKVSRETYAVLSRAIQLARSCPGCFDVTVAPLVALWHEAKEALSQPDPSRIRRALSLVDARDLALDPWKRTAGLRKGGQSIDLGGIGKGYAGDKTVEVLRGLGISSACSNLGGNVVTLGARPDGGPWQVGIQHPRQEKSLLGAVSVVDQTVVTSGDYQRCYTDRQGKRHHHILDPRTGYPAQSGLISVSIVSNHSIVADALSTAVFVAGLERGLEFLGGFSQTEAILVDSRSKVYVTSGLRDRFQAAPGVAVTILD
jgi:thiamine biosynthesis lipoprotein